MMKFLLLIVLMFFIMGLATLMMRRLATISERIADLQSDMRKSQMKLDAQMQVLKEKRRAEQENNNLLTENLETDEVEEKNS